MKNKGCAITKTAVINENFLWNFIILSIPKNLSKNLAVSPEIINIERNRKLNNPANFPMEYNPRLIEISSKINGLKTTNVRTILNKLKKIKKRKGGIFLSIVQLFTQLP